MFECRECFAQFNIPVRDVDTGDKICPECGSDNIRSLKDLPFEPVYKCRSCSSRFSFANLDPETGNINVCPICGSLDYGIYEGDTDDYD